MRVAVENQGHESDERSHKEEKDRLRERTSRAGKPVSSIILFSNSLCFPFYHIACFS